MMQLGAEGVFVGSGMFKPSNLEARESPEVIAELATKITGGVIPMTKK